ncbi:uncharacterized protein NFIA_100320 [Aspergillus fischeri NRRL 181]|uniref:Uncharacterized protein n=1 Tax=Neosartorya fischeri (strain ATCC 1020 / DSM 3700 / CBS 544.65 / FGSC A1164 / JCM 1740 / NRRL 181 / WB 181) TaxID=331117 RepID=A1DC05_NEOFI|nr:uncharacterized protein NFIA_100320 [Aspergillus fischeri NRRL 181]EAW20395.1 hypothetical protein NFIA_100320 [Aspergillus fischeri NRRL 181]
MAKLWGMSDSMALYLIAIVNTLNGLPIVGTMLGRQHDSTYMGMQALFGQFRHGEPQDVPDPAQELQFPDAAQRPLPTYLHHPDEKQVSGEEVECT